MKKLTALIPVILAVVMTMFGCSETTHVNADIGKEPPTAATVMYTMPDIEGEAVTTAEPTTTEEPATEPPVESGYIGKWEASRLSFDGDTYTDDVDGVPIGYYFRLEINDDESAVFSGYGYDELTAERYTWSVKDGTLKLTSRGGDKLEAAIVNGALILSDSNDESLYVYMKKVSEFTSFDIESYKADKLAESELIAASEGKWAASAYKEDGTERYEFDKPLDVLYQLEVSSDKTADLYVDGEKIECTLSYGGDGTLTVNDINGEYQQMSIETSAGSLILTEGSTVITFDKVKKFPTYDPDEQTTATQPETDPVDYDDGFFHWWR